MAIHFIRLTNKAYHLVQNCLGYSFMRDSSFFKQKPRILTARKALNVDILSGFWSSVASAKGSWYFFFFFLVHIRSPDVFEYIRSSFRTLTRQMRPQQSVFCGLHGRLSANRSQLVNSTTLARSNLNSWNVQEWYSRVPFSVWRATSPKCRTDPLKYFVPRWKERRTMLNPCISYTAEKEASEDFKSNESFAQLIKYYRPQNFENFWLECSRENLKMYATNCFNMT